MSVSVRNQLSVKCPEQKSINARWILGRWLRERWITFLFFFSFSFLSLLFLCCRPSLLPLLLFVSKFFNTYSLTTQICFFLSQILHIVSKNTSFNTKMIFKINILIQNNPARTFNKSILYAELASQGSSNQKAYWNSNLVLLVYLNLLRLQPCRNGTSEMIRLQG